ncbi:MAG: HDOD domain-containing protein [bacterium]|nr:HDOD domain-containing protein [bacterium]
MTLDEAVARIEDIPTIPTVLGEILRITSSEKSSVKDLAQVIYSDQSLATKILKMANSSFYQLVQQVKSIDRAIVVLGFEEVRAIAMAMSVFDSVYLRRGGVYYNRLRSWNHSLLCGLGTRILGSLVVKSRGLIAELFVGGLIHDIGKVLMDRYFPEQFARVLELVEETSISMEAAERKIFGFDHALLAGRLLKKWKFPNQLIDMVLYHHHPELARDNQCWISLLSISDLMCHQLGYSTYACEPKLGLRKLLRSEMMKGLAQMSGLPYKSHSLIDSLRKLKEHLTEVDRLSGILLSP